MICIALLAYNTCSSRGVKMKRDPSFSDPINKLFIVVNHGQVDNLDSAYTPLLMTALKNEFSQKGVETEIRVVSPLALNENAYLAEIASYNPDGVMTIVTSGGVMGPYGGMTKILYDVSLFDPSKESRIWRAQIDASGGTAVREKRMQMMAHDLIQRLSEDKIISSEPRKKKDQL